MWYVHSSFTLVSFLSFTIYITHLSFLLGMLLGHVLYARSRLKTMREGVWIS